MKKVKKHVPFNILPKMENVMAELVKLLGGLINSTFKVEIVSPINEETTVYSCDNININNSVGKLTEVFMLLRNTDGQLFTLRVQEYFAKEERPWSLKFFVQKDGEKELPIEVNTKILIGENEDIFLVL